MPYIVGSLPQSLTMKAGVVKSAITTTTSASASVLVSLSTETFRSANYQIQCVRGSDYNFTEIKVIHDGNQAYMTEFGTINQPTGIATYSTDVLLGNIRLLGFPSSSDTTTFKVVYTAIND